MRIRVPRRTTVLVKHGSSLVHEGLCSVLSRLAGVQLVDAGEASVTHDLPVPPDVVVADYGHGLAYCRSRSQAARGACIRRPRLVIVTHLGREGEIREALTQGVEGYISETSSLAEFEHGFRQVQLGARFVSDCFSSSLVGALDRPRLTSREMSVLALIAVGLSNKAAANALDVAPGTVKTHVKAILAKLEVNSRTEAAHVAQRRGLVPIAESKHANRVAQLKAGH